MQDDTRSVLDAETPVNPYSLLEAVNRSSRAAGLAWLAFLALLAYVAVTLGGITHRDLLLNSAVTLPLLQVKVDLVRFFLFAPVVVVLAHAALLGQFALLAGKTVQFASALRMLEPTDQRTHPLRLEVGSFFFVQAKAGPERSRIMGAFLHGMSWLTLVLLPLLLVLYAQVAFLPFHDAGVTAVHRLVVLADLVLLLAIGVFLVHPETSIVSAYWNAAVTHPLGFLLSVAGLVTVSALSVFLATVPGEPLDRISPAGANHRQGGEREQATVLGVAVPGLVGPDGSLFGLFPRNLVVTDAALASGSTTAAPGRPALNLRGRDLRFARLDRSDLRRADLTGASLDGASLVGADLRGIAMQCADIDELLQRADREGARCAGSARGADFARALLAEAALAGVDLRAARFEGAQLEGADLAQAQLTGATFLMANLQGADLGGARLQAADLSSARLQGANLQQAGLEGAVLRDADLEGASLQAAKLHGANLRNAKLQGADLAGVSVWRTTPPGGEAAALGSLSNILFGRPGEADVAALKAVVSGIETGPLRDRLSELLGPLQDGAAEGAWSDSPDGQAWAGLQAASEAAMADTYRARLTEYLAGLACRPRFADGMVASGIARRAVRPGFKGDPAAFYDRLKAADCAASAAVPPRLMRDLAAAADAARGQ
jgi:uncharacterized protein YjbI with pentapeptide repeats